MSYEFSKYAVLSKAILSSADFQKIPGKKSRVARGREGLAAQCSKIRKKVQFQNCKKALFEFSKMAKKSIYAPEKSLNLPKNAIFGLKKKGFLVVLNFFLMQKLIFYHF